MQRERLGERLRSRLLTPAQEGNILVLSALMMVVLIALAGLAIDVGYEMDRFREAQNTADTLALAGAKAVNADENYSSMSAALQDIHDRVATTLNVSGFGPASWTISYLDGNEQPIDFNPGDPTGANNLSTLNPTAIKYVRADVADSFPTFFIRVLGITGNTVGTHAIAKVQWQPQCELCVLDPSASGALSLTGSGGFSGTNIRVIDNSNNASALVASGNGTLNDQGPDAQVYVVGGTSISGGGGVTPTATTGVQPIPDPLLGLPLPQNIPVGSCAVTGNGHNPCDKSTPPNMKLDNSYKGSSLTLNPGVFASIDDESSTPLILSPGIYVVTGVFKDVAQSVITGNGVMIYLTCPSSSAPYYTACTSATSTSGGSLNLAGGSTVVLSAPTPNQQICSSTSPGIIPPPPPGQTLTCPSAWAYSGGWVPWQFTGLLIFQDRQDTLGMTLAGTSSNAPPTSSCTGVSSGSSCISGTIYAHAAQITITGGGSQQTALMSYVVADQVAFQGNGGSGSPQSFDMSFPQGLNAPLAETDGLVE